MTLTNDIIRILRVPKGKRIDMLKLSKYGEGDGGSRKKRRDRLRHRSSDRTDAFYVGFDDLEATFDAAYPWKIKIERGWKLDTQLTELLFWCADNFGPSDYFMPYVRKDGCRGRYQQSRNVRLTTRMRWNHIGWTFYFKTQEDATLFRVMKT